MIPENWLSWAPIFLGWPLYIWIYVWITGDKNEVGTVKEAWCERRTHFGRRPCLSSRLQEAKEHYIKYRRLLWGSPSLTSTSLLPPLASLPQPVLFQALSRGLFTKIKCIRNANLLGKYTRLVRVEVISCPGSSSHESGHHAPKLALIKLTFLNRDLARIRPFDSLPLC